MISILMIEDEPDIVSYVRDFAEEWGHRLVATDNAKEAILKCRNQRFDLILLDLHLKSGSGDEVVERVRLATSLNYLTPIILVSGNIEQKGLLKMAKKVNGALVKPFDADQIKAVFDKVSKAA